MATSYYRDILKARGEIYTCIVTFTDATELWRLNKSTLRKVLTYGKLINGVDACKFGKQWVISSQAMEREYGKSV